MKTDNIFYDKEFRGKIRNTDKELLAQLMADSIGDVQVKVVTNTKDITYLAIPVNTGTDFDLQSVQAGVGLSTYATALGSIGCASSTISTASSASTVGSMDVNI